MKQSISTPRVKKNFTVWSFKKESDTSKFKFITLSVTICLIILGGNLAGEIIGMIITLYK